MTPPRLIASVAAICFALGGLAYALWLRPAPAPVDTVGPVPVETGDPQLADLGDYSADFSIANQTARRWFNQGLVLAYGFNHDAAGRAFLRAAELDAACAMCWWGAALVLGPHINAGMEAADYAQAWIRIGRARQLAGTVSARERAYIEALATRYAPSAPASRRDLDQAYAEAMRELVTRYPQDPDARTLFAEALMNLHPWNLYDRQGRPREWTHEIIAVLERVLQDHPEHPGANHLYIHAVEASAQPQRALDAAHRLETLAPDAGHLVHMASHIYLRTGRYFEASRANLRAIAADQRYLERCQPGPGLYIRGYIPHNQHFLFASSMMLGDSAKALTSAGEVALRMDLERSRQPGYLGLQHYWAAPYFARIRFGRWGELLAEPLPDLPYPAALLRYGRGLAQLRQGRLEAARQELEALRALKADPALRDASVWGLHAVSTLLEIAERILDGEIAAASGRWSTAIESLQSAVALADTLSYDEPPAWPIPVRHNLGAVLLRAGKAAQAETVYRADLDQFPDNGWALHGLVRALRAQNKPADEVQARLDRAWAHADVELTDSHY